MNKNKILALLALTTLTLTACGQAQEVADKQTVKEEVPVEEITHEDVNINNTQEVEKREDVVVDGELKIGKKLNIGDYDIEIQSLELIEDDSKKPGIKVTYTWYNNSEEVNKPYLTFNLGAFQEGESVLDDHWFTTGQIDLEPAQQDVKPGESAKDLETYVPLDTIEKDVLIELREGANFSETSNYKETFNPKEL